jgi:hypothetical protein
LPLDAGRGLSSDKQAYTEAIWPVIAQANAAAPSHSRILPEMVEILPYGTDIPIVRDDPCRLYASVCPFTQMILGYKNVNTSNVMLQTLLDVDLLDI